LLAGGGVFVVALRGINKASEGGREDVGVCSCRVCALLLQGAHEALWILDGGMLELLERLEVALALLALQLQERYGGAQGYGIGVLAL
jgi:hypothetical protein